MSDNTGHQADLAVRASDAEREQAVALLQRSFADGRLTRDELEERAGAAYAAQTRAQLSVFTADLPRAEHRSQRQGGQELNPRLLCILLCVCPHAALVYWLLWLHRRRHRRVAGPESAEGLPPVLGQAAEQPAGGQMPDGVRRE